MVDVIKVECPSDMVRYKCPYEINPQFIVVHNTANDASARNEIRYMHSNYNQVSFHYAIDDKEVVQGIEENRNTWNAGDGRGDGNMKGISIEMCYSKSGGIKYNNAEALAIKFIAQLLKQKGWGIDRVKKHQDFSGKYCPHRILDNGWDNFLDKIKQALEGKNNVENSDSFLVYVDITKCSSLNIRQEPIHTSKLNGTIPRTQVLSKTLFTITEVKNNWGKLKSGAGWINLYYTKKK